MADDIGSRLTGIVLVGTHPWTNSAFDTLLPRPLLPIANRPLISYALSWLHDAAIRDVAVCANRETRALQATLERHVPAGMRVSYLEDPMPRGAAGCLRDAAWAAGGDTFVVADGTAIPHVDLCDLLSSHRFSGAVATVVVDCEPGHNGTPGLQAPAGIYVFDRRALDIVPPHGFYDIKESLIPQLYRFREHVVTYRTSGTIPRVLGASTYLAVNEWMVEQLVTTGKPLEGYSRSGSRLVHSHSFIADDAVLVGSVLVGPDARIMSGAVIVGPTSMGPEATVERGAVVIRSAVWRRSFVSQQAIADRCILADDTFVEPHAHAFRCVMVANSRRERHDVRVASRRLDLRQAAALELRRLLGT